MLGNGIVGILSESSNIWERRAPLTPAHCARLLHSGKGKNGVQRIIVQPSTRRIYHDFQYEDVGCEVSDDLSECGLILGVKQPKIFSQRATLYDYELIVGDNGKRLLAFGKFAGRAGLIDFLHGLGKRYLNLGYSTPFLSLGASHMYPSLAAAKAAVIAVGEEIATQGLPLGVSPIVFVFVGNGNGYTLLSKHYLQVEDLAHHSPLRKRVFKVYGCVVTSQDFVEPKDPTGTFDKVDYYAHPDHYNPVFHERIAPYASVIDHNWIRFPVTEHLRSHISSNIYYLSVNCMYWENRFLRLLTTKQMQELAKNGCPLVGVSDITCDIGGSIEFVNQLTTIEKPFFRYNPFADSYHDDMDGDGLICLAVDILPTEFSRESSQHFGDILSQFVRNLAWAKNMTELPLHLQRACIAHGGSLTPLYEYIPRMRNSSTIDLIAEADDGSSSKRKYSTLVSLSGHLFDQMLINEALDIVEAAGGSFRLVKCEVGQSINLMSYSELEISADDITILDQICAALTLLANPSHKDDGAFNKDKELSLKVSKVSESIVNERNGSIKRPAVLILGAGRVCQPAAELLASAGDLYSNSLKIFEGVDAQECEEFEVIVASLYQKDAEETIEGIMNARAVQLDVMNEESLSLCISQVEVVLSLLPASFHGIIAKSCIEHKKHLVTASYVDDSMSAYHEKAKDAGVTILCEMGLDPGIGNELYDSAVSFRIPDLPAFALEYLPNRNSLVYGDLYGISAEASTIFRATLRYEGFSEIMACLGKLGFFDMNVHPKLKGIQRPTFGAFLNELLKKKSEYCLDSMELQVSLEENEIIKRVMMLGCCKEAATATKTAKTIRFLGLHDDAEIPEACSSAFDVICLRMQERLSYSSKEQDMVLLHHEIQVEYPDGRPTENHKATLLEFGKTENGKTTTAMALTVGVPAAIGVLLLLKNKIQTKGVIRPTEPEVYMPALQMLEACEINLLEKIETL
ncbi:Alpha-aminoadipic semialdehyde synthase [Dendrobium catenatum]|uniref:Alpha-aminoadipic semialdehyde synthase n=1 Tax=Dendrobium catenatum TaxID=906689 RepID=A0A2I0WDU3_9ASPA|nr:Alpha-aminoadipic semialdehyde synthase [Dendrobium catenatum]